MPHDPQNIFRLMSFFSPVFPIGAFSYSSGLESAVEKGFIKDRQDLLDWLISLTQHGFIHNDAIITSISWRTRAQLKDLHFIEQTVQATASSESRFEEQITLGKNFVAAIEHWQQINPSDLPDPISLPVAVGALCHDCQIPEDDMIVAYIQSIQSNLIQAALRLAPIGQNAGVEILSGLMQASSDLYQKALGADLDHLVSSSYIADALSMAHETQTVRIFRS